MTLGRAERLKLFYQRLEAAPLADSFEAAFALIAQMLNQVEDEHSGDPNQPDRWWELERMFPPQLDRVEAVRNRSRVWKARSFRHYTLIGSNGSIEIWSMPRRGGPGEDILEFQKDGADGKGLPS